MVEIAGIACAFFGAGYVIGMLIGYKIGSLKK